MGLGVSPKPRPPLPPGKNQYPLHWRLGGRQGWSRRAENLVQTEIRSRTVKPEVSRYTEWATRPTKSLVNLYKKVSAVISEMSEILHPNFFQYSIQFLTRKLFNHLNLHNISNTVVKKHSLNKLSMNHEQDSVKGTLQISHLLSIILK